ncbi:MAG: hypothetical protein JWN62_2453 [Acidimicrobiales bacterium]|nr:hypothetical protein [Acidimicrobiales bacterium]
MTPEPSTGEGQGELEGEGGVDVDTLPAGSFSEWLGQMQAAIRGEAESDVPCGECTACCTASQFIHIGPDELDAKAHIPAALLFPAPRMPKGHVLMGYDEHGRCPMLIEGRCSIYAHRPRTCRTYDCRVFAAAGLEPDEADKALIAERVRRWRFSHPSPQDEAAHDAVRAVAVELIARPDALPLGIRPDNTTQIAVLAVERTTAVPPPTPPSGQTDPATDR